MFPKYIILPDTSRTLTIASAKVTKDPDDNPTYEWYEQNVGFTFIPDLPHESFCFQAILEEDSEPPALADTIAFEAYDSDDNLICSGKGGNRFWL